MITLDASLVIAHLEPRDPHHDPATSFLREYAGQPLLIHPLNLTEVLVGGVRSGRGRELMDDLRAIGIDVASPEDTDPSRLATLQVETGLKLPDCCALDTALRTGSTLATLDDRLAAAARARHLTVRPTLG